MTDELHLFKKLSFQIPHDQKLLLYKQFVDHPEKGVEAIVDIASQHGLTLSKEEVSELIKAIDDGD